MMQRLLRWLLIACAVFACLSARAITCSSITSTGVSMTYYNRTSMLMQGTFTATCTRTAGDPSSSVTYDVTVNDGANPTNQGGNRAFLGSGSVKYDLYTDSGCATLWNGTNKISATISWPGNKTDTRTQQSSYWLCIPTQAVGGSGGTYTDTVTMTLAYAGGASITGNIPVDIFAPANCSISTQPGTIALNYVALGPQVSNSTTFSVTCTTGMPFTVAPNVPEGVLVNVRYILSLNKSSSNGQGVPETFTVTATIPGGQAGTCTGGTCTASQTHTIVISY